MMTGSGRARQEIDQASKITNGIYPFTQADNGHPKWDGNVSSDEEYCTGEEGIPGVGFERQLGRTERTRLKTKHITNRMKEKTVEVFSHNHDHRGPADPLSLSAVNHGRNKLGVLDADPVINPRALLDSDKPEAQNIPSTTGVAHLKGEARSLLQKIAHPKTAVQNAATHHAASHLSSAQRPFLSYHADKELLEAHEELYRAESKNSRKEVTDNSQPEIQPIIYTNENENEEGDSSARQRQKIEQLEAHRQGLNAAWTTGRHVDRVCAIHPRKGLGLDFPAFDDSKFRDEEGQRGRFRWDKWLGHLLLYYAQDFSAQYIDDEPTPPIHVENLSRVLERLVLASAPWQAWWMSVKHVYQWQNPKQTGKWLALYVVLWYTEHIVGFIYAYIIYMVLKSRYYPNTIEAVRDSFQRAIDRGSQAHHWGEIVDKHGRDSWVEPLLEELGPWLQLQLGDLTSFLEVLENFYAWRAPQATAATLFFLVSCLLVTLVADMQFCMKIVWFVIGGHFFLCWPVASLYPRYRMIVYPVKWVLWDIPTRSEWSFKYLQHHVSILQYECAGYSRDPSDDNELDDDDFFIDNDIGGLSDPANAATADYGATSKTTQTPASTTGPNRRIRTCRKKGMAPVFQFRAYHHRSTGHLLITDRGIQFVRQTHRHSNGKNSLIWECPYSDIAEMRKLAASRKSKLVKFDLAVDDIEFQSSDGELFKVAVTKGSRDEVFNLVIGMSGSEGVQWKPTLLDRGICIKLR